MSDVLIRALEGQGIWTIVCILLVIYVLKETEKREARSISREEKLLEIIDNFKEHFGQLREDVNIIKVDVDDIKEQVKRGDKE